MTRLKFGSRQPAEAFGKTGGVARQHIERATLHHGAVGQHVHTLAIARHFGVTDHVARNVKGCTPGVGQHDELRVTALGINFLDLQRAAQNAHFPDHRQRRRNRRHGCAGRRRRRGEDARLGRGGRRGRICRIRCGRWQQRAASIGHAGAALVGVNCQPWQRCDRPGFGGQVDAFQAGAGAHSMCATVTPCHHVQRRRIGIHTWWPHAERTGCVAQLQAGVLVV